MPIEPAPIVVPPSGNFQGNDGSWSTVNITVGNPPQTLQVLPATQIPEIWTVIPLGCGSLDPSNCTQGRGGTFDVSKSSSWISKAPYALQAESNLGYTKNSDNGNYGFDTIGVGKPGAGNVSVDGQVVAGLATKDFYLGNLGLASRTISFNSDNDAKPSFLSSLRNRSLIPSLAYGFTAGASYRGADASLTLGGYDASMFTPNDVNFSFAPAPTRQLVVGLKSITYSDAKNKNSALLPQGILTLVDSTTPQIWLPLAACQSFEKAFGIVYDPIWNLYFVNQTVHDALLQQNASTTFELSNALNGGPSVQITLPYASFDLEIGPPFAKNTSKYFPLRRAADDTQYTLGRTLLQESYLTVNYETSNFSISQLVYGQNTQPHILPILSTNSTTTDTTSPTAGPKQPQVSISTGNGSHSIGTGAIAGIVVAIVLITLICGALVFYCRPSKRHQKSRESVEVDGNSAFPKNAQEMEHRQFSNPMAEKKYVDVTTQETTTPMTPLAEADSRQLGASPSGNHELGGDPIALRSELESPPPFERSELPSSEHGLTTPELAAQKRYSGASSLDKARIRSRITSAILSSPVTEWAPSGQPSPESEIVSAASPGPQSPFGETRSRPSYPRQDSFEAGSASQRRSRPEPSPLQRQNGSLESEAGFTPLHGRTNSSSSGQWGRGRPSAHERLGSQDSNDSWETRLAQTDVGPAYYGTSRAQATPSPLLESQGHEEARSAMSSPETGSVRSALISPELPKTFEDSRESSIDVPRPQR